jgi:hypothetical protein
MGATVSGWSLYDESVALQMSYLPNDHHRSKLVVE